MAKIDFVKEHPCEANCKRKLKEFGEQAEVVCPKCGGTAHYWKRDEEHGSAKSYRTWMRLKSGMVMHKQRLLFRYKFIVMHLLTSPKKSLSAYKLQYQFGRKHYHSIRYGTQATRGDYVLVGRIELDEGFFSTVINPDSWTRCPNAITVAGI